MRTWPIPRIMNASFLIYALLLTVARPSVAGAEEVPFFVDLRETANAGLEDDGIADNGAGGWTDEGINDMFLWPPLPLGENEYNGYPFHVIDPESNEGRSVLVLRGRDRCQDKPVEATVSVPEVKGRFVYFLQNAAGSVAGQPEAYTVATYTISYADGSQVEVPMRDGIEIRQWWTSDGNDHHDEIRRPAHVGKNLYTEKWRQMIGLWATRWANPHPDKPITAIQFSSHELAVPILFAVTISDQDYAQKRREPEPVGPIPKDYFIRKMAQEERGLFQAMIDVGHVQGIRSIELIRNDVLAVTVDAALTQRAFYDTDADRYQTPDSFTVTSPTDPDYAQGQRPAKVGRLSYERWNGDVGRYPGCVLYWHEYYLTLPTPMKPGHRYDVKLPAIPERFRSSASLGYDDAMTHTKVIKVNQVGYSPLATRRYAYLGWWAGDAGAVDYSQLSDFTVVDESNNQEVLEGKITPRQLGDPLSGEDVYEMDLSALKPGQYHVRVRSLGRSDSFAVGQQTPKQLYYHAMRGFFHQRCGQEFKEPWTWVTKAPCHVWCWESGYLVENPRYQPKPDEEKRSFVGGYHDAADFDHFTYHLRATAQVLTMYERTPDAFTDDELNLPESGNGIPDVLDEARWGLFWYRDHQQPDGGVPLGRGNDSDAFAQQTGGQRTPFGILPVKNAACTEFAAVAAQYARVIERFDADEAKSYLDAAERAFAWAEAHPDKDEEAQRLRAWAAAELFCATGKQAYHDVFKQLVNDGVLDVKEKILDQHLPVFMSSYVHSEREDVDREIQERLRRMLIEKADALVESLERPAYRMSHGGETFLGWGTGNGGGHYADPLLRAYWLTGGQKYLDAASLNADFQLGCNPLAKTFVTGLGARPPVRPEISGFLYEGPGYSGRTVEGITVYGLAGDVAHNWHPAELPKWRKWRDLWSSGAEISSEFTIPQTIGPSAMLYGTLYAFNR